MNAIETPAGASPTQAFDRLVEAPLGCSLDGGTNP